MFARTVNKVGRTVAKKTRSSAKTNSRPLAFSAKRGYRNNGYKYSRYSTNGAKSTPYRLGYMSMAGGAAVGVSLYLASVIAADDQTNWEKIRKEIEEILHDDEWDDGSWGPVLLRLAWHASGTYDKNTRTGGSDGATMRFAPESAHGANAGLAHARERLEEIKKRHPEVSYADLWTFAGVVAAEAMGSTKIKWRPGRSDAKDATFCPPDGKLPDASQGSSHVRDIFHRMGFDDKEIVALLGAHALGRCHPDRSGYDGPWTNSPTMLTNDFYERLLNSSWNPRKWNGPLQYEDETKQLMMLPADVSLLLDPIFRNYVKKYAEDEAAFKADFASAFSKLLELGVDFNKKTTAVVPPKSEAPKNRIEEPKYTEKPVQKPWWKFW